MKKPVKAAISVPIANINPTGIKLNRLSGGADVLSVEVAGATASVVAEEEKITLPMLPSLGVVMTVDTQAEVKSALREAAARGEKFAGGRKPDAIGPVRKAIRKVLNKWHDATNEEIWSAIEATPPKGMDLYPGTDAFERYIMFGGKQTTWKTFKNHAAEERSLLRLGV